jgi:hypothetical protein
MGREFDANESSINGSRHQHGAEGIVHLITSMWRTEDYGIFLIIDFGNLWFLWRRAIPAQSNFFRRNPSNDCHGSNVGINYCAGTDDRAFANGHAVEDASASANPNVILNGDA